MGYPEKFWHCAVTLSGRPRAAIVNDLSYAELMGQIVTPWLQARPFTVNGTVVGHPSQVTDIKIAHTDLSQLSYAQRHDAKMRASGIGDLVTNRRSLPLSEGKDYTYELLFSGASDVMVAAPNADMALVERVCKRVAYSARILGTRQRKDKTPYLVEDEYDVQDLLHALLRAYLKYSVQEDPLRKVAGARAGRADISIEDLGILVEVKYTRGPSDQKRIFDEFSQDLVLYASWQPLKTLFFVIYNSSDLRDPEALEKLGGTKEIDGKRFDTVVILA